MLDSDHRERARTDADVMARRIVGLPASAREQGLYVQALERSRDELDVGSRRLWSLMMRRPRAFATLDAGLALVDPGGPIRRRLLTMVAILEASPDHAALFLPPTDRRSPPWPLLAGLVRGGLRAIVGVPLVLAIRRGAA